MTQDQLVAERTTVEEIWYTRCPVPTTSGLAHHFGFIPKVFARQGVAVKTIFDSPDPEVRRSHFTHSLPASFREGGNIPAIWAQAGGQRTAVVGISWVDEEQLVLVRPDSGINSLSDLKGKKLGIPKNTAKVVDFPRAQDLHGLVTALKLGGLTPKDAEIVDIQGHDFEERGAGGERKVRSNVVADALADGRVDAIYAKGAASAGLVKERGFKPLFDINAHPDPFVRVNTGTPRPVTVNWDLVQSNPEIVARYLATLLKTAAWAKTHPAEIVEAVTSETRSTPERVRRGYGPDLHLHFDIGLSSQYVEGLRQQKDFLWEWGFLESNFDYDAWIAREPLRLAHQILEREGLAI